MPDEDEEIQAANRRYITTAINATTDKAVGYRTLRQALNHEDTREMSGRSEAVNHLIQISERLHNDLNDIALMVNRLPEPDQERYLTQIDSLRTYLHAT